MWPHSFSLTPNFFIVLVFCGCHDKLLHTEWLKTTHIHFLMVLEARSPKSKCGQSALPLQAQAESPLASSGCWWPQAFCGSQTITPTSVQHHTALSPLCLVFVL